MVEKVLLRMKDLAAASIFRHLFVSGSVEMNLDNQYVELEAEVLLGRSGERYGFQRCSVEG